MATSLRYFLVQDDGEILAVPMRVINGLIHDNERLPAYAGQRIRLLSVWLELIDGRPHRALQIDASKMPLDDTGAWTRVAEGLRVLDWADRPAVAVTSGNVTDISRQIEYRGWYERNRWQPTPKQITAVMNLIWPPKNAARRKPNYVKGVLKRRPPMTYEAQRAFDDCLSSVVKIATEIQTIKDKSLKAFIALCEEDANSETSEYRELFRGLIAQAEKQIKINKAWASPKGKWVAALECTVWRDDGQPRVGDVRVVEKRVCDGKQAAVQACREMLAAHANEFMGGTSLQARTCPEIVWGHDL